MEMEAVDHSVSVSEITRKVCRTSTAAKFRRRQVGFLQLRCAQVDGYVLALRTGPFREEFVGSLAMAELVRVLQRALWIVKDASADPWLQHALARQIGSQEVLEVIQDLNRCVDLMVNRVSCDKMETLRRKTLEDAEFVNRELLDAAAQDMEDLKQELMETSSRALNASHLVPGLAEHLLRKLRPGECELLEIRNLELGKFVGNGASGTVFSASWFEYPVAVKTFKKYDSTYEREKEAMSKLVHPHPNILQILGCCENSNQEGSRIVMELMQMDLRKFIDKYKDRQLPLLVAVDIMLQIARGTRYLHDNHVVHRDLKPQNILVDAFVFDDHDSGKELFPNAVRIRLTDFGISKTEFNTHVVANDLTDMRGTTKYMAPEVMAKNSYSRKVDVYSFAITCSEILTKSTPFGYNAIGVKDLRKMLDVGHRPSLPEDCDAQLKDLIEKCWSGDPDQRPLFEEIEENLTNLKGLLLKGQNICTTGICSSCSNSLSTTSSNCTLVPFPRTTTFSTEKPKLIEFRLSRGSHDVGSKVKVQFKFADGAKWAICRWKREPRSGPTEFKDPLTVSDTSLVYNLTALDYDKRVSLECRPVNEQMNFGDLVTGHIKDGDYIGLGSRLMETTDRYWNNGQATFQVHHLHHRWWESSGKLIINQTNFLLWWGHSNAKNLRTMFGPEHGDAAPVELNEDDGALLCTLKGNDQGSCHKVKFADTDSRDTAVLTLKRFWMRHRQNAMQGR